MIDSFWKEWMMYIRSIKSKILPKTIIDFTEEKKKTQLCRVHRCKNTFNWNIRKTYADLFWVAFHTCDNVLHLGKSVFDLSYCRAVDSLHLWLMVGAAAVLVQRRHQQIQCTQRSSIVKLFSSRLEVSFSNFYLRKTDVVWLFLKDWIDPTGHTTKGNLTFAPQRQGIHFH
jgi:hypothetical protein